MHRSVTTFDSQLEKRFFRLLRQVLPAGYIAQPQLPLSSFIENWEMDNLNSRERWLIMSCSIDFTICVDDANLTPLIPLEIDGYTNGESRGTSYFSLETDEQAKSREAKFNFKLRLLRGLGFPLQVLPGDMTWNENSLRRKLWMSSYECASPNLGDSNSAYYKLAQLLVGMRQDSEQGDSQQPLRLVQKG